MKTIEQMLSMTIEEQRAYIKAQNPIHPMLTVVVEMLRQQTDLYSYSDGFGREDEMTYRFDSENPYEWWLKEEVAEVVRAYGCEVWYDVDDELYVCYIGVPL